MSAEEQPLEEISPEESSERRPTGIFGRWLSGCFVVIAVLVLVGVFIFFRVRTTVRWGAGEGLRLFADRACRRLLVPDDVRLAVVAPVASFSIQVKSGERALGSVFRIMRAFEQGPLHASLLVCALHHNNLVLAEARPDGEPPKKLLQRFYSGIKAGRIPFAAVGSITMKLSEKREMFYPSDAPMEIKEKTWVLRKTIPPEELSRLMDEIAVLTGSHGKAATAPVEISPVTEIAAVLRQEMSGRKGPH